MNEKESYAGFWRRLAAYLIDYLILYIPYYFIDSTYGHLAYLSDLFIAWPYYAIMESSKKQATVGKIVLGIIVTDLNGNKISFVRATGRFFAQYISTIILFIGYIMIAFTECKQGLHDIIAGTLVWKKTN